MKPQGIQEPLEVIESELKFAANDMGHALNYFVQLAHNSHVAAGWWSNIKTGERVVRNKGELLTLIVSEIGEAMEGERKNLMDDHLPHRKMAEVELADAVIRIWDYCGGFGYDLGGAIVEKMQYNLHREDHKLEVRRGQDGKVF